MPGAFFAESVALVFLHRIRVIDPTDIVKLNIELLPQECARYGHPPGALFVLALRECDALQTLRLRANASYQRQCQLSAPSGA